MSDLSGYVSSLTVEDGTGKTDSDSYISVDNADIYVQDHYGGASTWLDLTEDQKEMYLRRAAQYIDSYYRKKWKGLKATSTQAMEWPRSGVCDASGYEVSSAAVPVAVQEAQVEAAILLQSGYSLQPVITGGESNIKRKKVGPIEVEYASASEMATTSPGVRTEYTQIKELLYGLIESGGRIILG